MNMANIDRPSIIPELSSVLEFSYIEFFKSSTYSAALLLRLELAKT